MAPVHHHFTLEGAIGAGKSSLLDALLRRLQRSPSSSYELRVAQEPVDRWTRAGTLQAFYADPARYALAFQMHVLLTRLQQAREVFFSSPSSFGTPTAGKARMVLTERCLASDCGVFARASRESGLLDDTQWGVYDAWRAEAARVAEAAGQPEQLSGVIYLRCSTETSARRIAARKRDGEVDAGDAAAAGGGGGSGGVDAACLERLQRAHERWLEEVRAAGTPVLMIDADAEGADAVEANAAAALDFMLLRSGGA
jgi:deoxyadenosine/deoxycytidine kinase